MKGEEGIFELFVGSSSLLNMRGRISDGAISVLLRHFRKVCATHECEGTVRINDSLSHTRTITLYNTMVLEGRLDSSTIGNLE